MRKNETSKIEMFLEELAELEAKYNVIITHADDNGVEVEYLPYWQYKMKIRKALNNSNKNSPNT